MKYFTAIKTLNQEMHILIEKYINHICISLIDTLGFTKTKIDTYLNESFMKSQVNQQVKQEIKSTIFSPIPKSLILKTHFNEKMYVMMKAFLKTNIEINISLKVLKYLILRNTT